MQLSGHGPEKEKRRNEDDDEKVDLDRFKGFTHNVAS